ncbi:hypothetical protein ACVRZA_10025 [Streptococcus halotolerans]
MTRYLVMERLLRLLLSLTIMTTRLTGGLNRGYKPTLPASA